MSPQRVGGDDGDASDCDEICASVLWTQYYGGLADIGFPIGGGGKKEQYLCNDNWKLKKENNGFSLFFFPYICVLIRVRTGKTNRYCYRQQSVPPTNILLS